MEKNIFEMIVVASSKVTALKYIHKMATK